MKSRAVVRYLSAAVLALFVLFLSNSASANENSSNGVSPFYGSFSTEVPIAVPPYHGLEPKLKLVYNSTAKNGFVGVGWNLAGVSYIERGLPGGGSPRYDTNDAFFLDGMELIPCILQGGTHCTEIQNYTKIVQDGETWTVWGTNGNKAIYTPKFTTTKGTFRYYLTSVTDTHGNTVNYNYATFGTPILFVYLDSITYNNDLVKISFYRETRNDTVSFATGAGLGKITGRLTSIAVEAGNPLDVIRAYDLQYELSEVTEKSLLISVQQYGNDAIVDGSGNISGETNIPAMGMAYSPDNNGTFAPHVDGAYYPGGDFKNDTQTFYTDINGDGKADQVITKNTTAYSETWVWLANGDGSLGPVKSAAYRPGDYKTNTQTFYADINGDGKSDQIIIWNTTGFTDSWIFLSKGDGTFGPHLDGAYYPGGDFKNDTQTFYTDINGDGKADQVITKNTTAYSETWVWLANEDGTLGPCISAAYRPGDYKTNTQTFYADINGDGKSDQIIIWNTTGFTDSWVFLSKGDGTFGPHLDGAYYPGGDFKNDTKTFYTDINGDGKADQVIIKNTTGYTESWTWLSNGDGSLGPVKSAAYRPGDYKTGAHVLYTDVNGDGMADQVITKNTTGYTESWTWLANGYGTFGPCISASYWPGDFSKTQTHFADINGDGKSDQVMIWNTTGYTDSWVWLSPAPPYNLLTTLQNGIGGTTNITYEPSSSWPEQTLPVGMVMQTVSSITTDDGLGNSSTTDYEYKGALWHHGEKRFLGFRYVKAWLDDVGNYTETYYLQQVGSISKPEVMRFMLDAGEPGNPADDLIYRFSEFDYDYNTEAPYTSVLQNRWEYECNLRPTAAGCFATLSQFGYDNYGNIEQTVEWGQILLDAAGNPVLDAQGYPESDPANPDERLTVRTIVASNDASHYLVSLPHTEEVFKGTVIEVNNLVKQVRFHYDDQTHMSPPDKGDVTKIEKWNDQTGSYVSVSMTYDAYGNALSKTNEVNTESVTVYDSTYHMYPVQEYVVLDPAQTCTPANHCVTTAWDMERGLKQSVTDPNEATISYTYDALGRLETETTPLPDNPNGFVTSYDYVNWGNAETQFVEKVANAGDPDNQIITETYQDGFGRTYLTVVKKDATDPTPLMKKTVYNDATNRPYLESFWYGQGEAARYVTITYDGLGRERFIYNPAAEGETPTYSEIVYANDENGNPYTKTYDEDGNHKYEWHDAYGNIVLVRETKITETETIEYDTKYKYDILGNLIEVKDNEGNVTSTEWDSLGRKISSDDPDMGHWTYTYYDDGSLHEQTDAKGQKVVFTYDKLGRVKTKFPYEADGTLNLRLSAEYYYDEVGYGESIGRLTRVVFGALIRPGLIFYSSFGGSETHTWDMRGQETQTSRYIHASSKTMTIQQGYDEFGRVESITYPDADGNPDEIVTNHYDEYGRLEMVTSNDGMGYVNNIIWSPNGQITQMDYANNTRNTFSYDPYRKWLNSAQVDKMNGEQVVATHYLAAYGYYKTGLVKDLALNNYGTEMNRSYVYDSLNRLINVNEYQSTNSIDTFDYDTIGNMTFNSTHNPDPVQGVYQYNDLNHAHAVTQTGDKIYAYDTNGNMTSVVVGGEVTKEYIWDTLNRLESVTNGTSYSSFKYDRDGNRIAKTTSNCTTYYFGSMLELNNDKLVKYYYAGSMLVAKKEVDGATTTTHWYHGDHLQSTRMMTDSDGNVANTYEYAAYGKTVNSTASTPNERGFTGHVTDEPDTGLIYMKARYYDAELGRFISADTIVQAPFNPQTLNRYSYCQNNPLIYIDPSGHFSFFKDIWETAKDMFSPIEAFEDGGILGLITHLGDPVMNTITYTHEGGIGTSGGWNYSGLDFGGGWQERGPNSGAYGYIGYGVTKGNFSAGIYLMNNQYGDYNVGAKAGYRGMGITAGYSSVSKDWRLGASYKYDGVTISYDFANKTIGASYSSHKASYDSTGNYFMGASFEVINFSYSSNNGYSASALGMTFQGRNGLIATGSAASMYGAFVGLTGERNPKTWAMNKEGYYSNKVRDWLIDNCNGWDISSLAGYLKTVNQISSREMTRSRFIDKYNY